MLGVSALGTACQRAPKAAKSHGFRIDFEWILNGCPLISLHVGPSTRLRLRRLRLQLLLAELGEELPELLALPVEGPAGCRQRPALLLRGVQAPCGAGLRGVQHEGHEAHQDGLDAPTGVPTLGVEVRHAETEPLVHLKPATGRDHHDRRRLQGILLGEHQLALVDPLMIRTLRRQLVDHEVPHQHVVRGPRHDMRRLTRLLDDGILAPEAGERRLLRHRDIARAHQEELLKAV